MKGLDTNVLVRYLTQDDPRQSPKASHFIKSACTGENPCYLNAVVLCELVWVLESAYGYPRESIQQVVERILETEAFQVQFAEQAWRAHRAYLSGADFSDAYIAAINQSVGCDETVTFDKQAVRVAGMKSL